MLWRWFAWYNQVLAAIALVVCTAYLIYESKTKCGSLITAVPMGFMIAVVVTFILGEPEMGFGKWIPLKIATICGCSVGILVFFVYLYFLHSRWKNDKLLKAKTEA